MTPNNKITIEAIVEAPIEKVWKLWNTPTDIMNWNAADPSWHCPSSENDLRVGGKFSHRMEAKDGSFGFDFAGIYDKVEELKEIEYTMADARNVNTKFSTKNNFTQIISTFDPESENDPEYQKEGWQAILNNFKNYAEKSYK